MNEVLGILIPMLMSGASPLDIIKGLSGNAGAAYLDGLEGIRRSQILNMPGMGSIVQNQSTINAAAERAVAAAGFNPYTSAGQGFSSLIGNLYHVAPDIVGSLIGVPNGRRFFGTIANGSAGISQAAGFGSVDMFNPYSVLAAHEMASRLARQVYDMGVRKGTGGYDISFGHGLNMDEMGRVTQRLLSSEMAYMDENGRRFNISEMPDGGPVDKDSAEKFSSNLKRLGSEFNEAASMLAKMTGSVDEALKVMDQMAGGNFLGGSADQAMDIARRAKSMAANIRITAAIGGISPQEAYANMAGLQQTIASSTGMSRYVAGASGYSSMMQNMAYNGTLAYTMWAAMNPTASIGQRSQALLAANGRAMRYAGSSGAALAAAVAFYRDSFTEDELREFEESYREGRPERMARVVRERIGSATYGEFMSNPSMQMAARYSVARDKAAQSLLDRFDVAGQEGNLMQAEIQGNRRLVRMATMDMDSSLSKSLGIRSGDLYNERRKAVEGELRRIAKEEYGAGSIVDGMNEFALRRFLENRPGMDMSRLERIVNTKTMEAAERQISDRTMTEVEEQSARQRFLDMINSETDLYGESGRKKFVEMVNNGVDLSEAFRAYAGNLQRDDIRRYRELRGRVFAGRLTAREAEYERERFRRVKDSQRVEFSAGERMDAIENSVMRGNVSNSGIVEGLASEWIKKNGGMTDAEALNGFREELKRISSEGKIQFKADDANVSRIYSEGAKRMVYDVLGGNERRLGKLEGEELEKFSADMSKAMMEAVYNGSSIGEAFSNFVGNLTDDQIEALGGKDSDGMKQLAKMAESAKNGGLKGLSMKDLVSSISSVAGGEAKENRISAVKEMRELAEGKFGGKTDAEATNLFFSLARAAGAFSGDEKNDSEIRGRAMSAFISDSLRGLGLSEEDIKAISDSASSKFEGAGGGDYEKAIASSFRDRAGGMKDGSAKNALLSMADKIEKEGSAGKAVIENILSEITPRGLRKPGFAAISQASTPDIAGIIMASAMTGVSFDRLAMNQYAPMLLSGADDAVADAKMNRFSNALGVGTGGFAKAAIEDTEKRIAELGEKLNGVDENTIRKALSGDNAAMATVEGRIGKGTAESEQRMRLLKTLGEGYKIGGRDALSVMMGGEGELGKLKKSGSTDMDVLEITRQSNRKDSDAYKILDEIGGIARKLSGFFSNPDSILGNRAIPVTVKGGNVNAEFSLWK